MGWHKKQRLLSNVMWANMIGQAAYQVGVICLLLFFYPYITDRIEPKSEYHFTLIFNTFVWCQICNEINSRKAYGELNCFEGLHKNYIFIAIIAITIVLQIIIVEGLG